MTSLLLRAAATLALTFVLGLSGCGGSSSGGSSGGSSGAGGAGGAGGSGATGGTGGSATSCPAAPPVEGASCSEPWSAGGAFGAEAHCTWGDDPRSPCRTAAKCVSGAWQLQAPDANACGLPLMPAGCASPPPANETVCPNSLLSCWYDDGTNCWCSSCKGGSGYPSCQTINPPEWYCASPKTGCPKTLPNAGTPCSVEGTECSNRCDLSVKCQAGVWEWIKASCPICAAPDTPIATPSGERPISELRPGDLVYSVDHAAIVAVPVLEVGHTRVRAHHVTRVALANGRVLEVSPGHPTADGRTFGDLRPGSELDGQPVISADLVPYRWDATWDILPASEGGTYFAAGAEIGSTLREQRALSRSSTPRQ